MRSELMFWVPVIAIVAALAWRLVSRTQLMVWLPTLVLVVLAIMAMAPHHWKGG
jgi:hypothetical protein